MNPEAEAVPRTVIVDRSSEIPRLKSLALQVGFPTIPTVTPLTIMAFTGLEEKKAPNVIKG
jgi:hypothetical protein